MIGKNAGLIHGLDYFLDCATIINIEIIIYIKKIWERNATFVDEAQLKEPADHTQI